jgi:hypothetical protein
MSEARRGLGEGLVQEAGDRLGRYFRASEPSRGPPLLGAGWKERQARQDCLCMQTPPPPTPLRLSPRGAGWWEAQDVPGHT